MVKSFERWEFEELQITFGLKRLKSMPILEQWLANETEFTAVEKQELERLRNKLQDNAEVWNEDELKFFFLSHLIDLVGYESPYYKAFTQRKLSATIGNIELTGVVDYMIATGIQNPRQPFFFIHEYKQERKREADPLGQVLSEMLAAQAKNEYRYPIFGSYVVGRFWFFVVLAENQYSVSLAYDSTKDDIFKIVSILRKVKDYIEEYLKLP